MHKNKLLNLSTAAEPENSDLRSVVLGADVVTGLTPSPVTFLTARHKVRGLVQVN